MRLLVGNEGCFSLKLLFTNKPIGLLWEVYKITDKLGLLCVVHLAVVSIDVPLKIRCLPESFVALVAGKIIQMIVVMVPRLQFT